MKSTHTAGDALIIISCYPACLAIVHLGESCLAIPAGLDPQAVKHKLNPGAPAPCMGMVSSLSAGFLRVSLRWPFAASRREFALVDRAALMVR